MAKAPLDLYGLAAGLNKEGEGNEFVLRLVLKDLLFRIDDELGTPPPRYEEGKGVIVSSLWSRMERWTVHTDGKHPVFEVVIAGAGSLVITWDPETGEILDYQPHDLAFKALGERQARRKGGRATKYSQVLQEELDNLVRTHPDARNKEIHYRLQQTQNDAIYYDGDEAQITTVSGEQRTLRRRAIDTYITRARKKLTQ